VKIILILLTLSICLSSNKETSFDLSFKNNHIISNYGKYKLSKSLIKKKIESINLKNMTINGDKIDADKEIIFYRKNKSFEKISKKAFKGFVVGMAIPLIWGAVGGRGELFGQHAEAYLFIGASLGVVGFMTFGTIAGVNEIANEIKSKQKFTINELLKIDCDELIYVK